MRKYLFVFLGILAVLAIYSVVQYNKFVDKEELMKLKLSEVNNVYQRRIDLIPGLVNIVKGQSDFEQTTLEKIAEARAKASSINFSNTAVEPQKFNSQEEIQDSLASATNRLIISIEKYPQLKGTDAYLGLQVQLEGTERRVKVARRDFNESVADYNSSVRVFPSSFVAKIFGFKPKEGFRADPNSDKAIAIKFK